MDKATGLENKFLVVEGRRFLVEINPSEGSGRVCCLQEKRLWCQFFYSRTDTENVFNVSSVEIHSPELERCSFTAFSSSALDRAAFRSAVDLVLTNLHLFVLE